MCSLFLGVSTSCHAPKQTLTDLFQSAPCPNCLSVCLSVTQCLGVRYNFCKSHIIDRFPNQFLPYYCYASTLGCDLHQQKPFQGTLFRFPYVSPKRTHTAHTPVTVFSHVKHPRLRTSAAATVSDIKKQAISTKQINALLSSFMKGPQVLLFLKHVEKITISQKKRTQSSDKDNTADNSSDASALETLFCVELTNVDEQTRKRREHLEDFAKSFDGLKKQEERAAEDARKKATAAAHKKPMHGRSRDRYDSDEEEEEEEEEVAEEEDSEESSEEASSHSSKSRANQRKQKKQTSTKKQVSWLFVCFFVTCSSLLFLWPKSLKFHLISPIVLQLKKNKRQPEPKPLPPTGTVLGSSAGKAKTAAASIANNSNSDRQQALFKQISQFEKHSNVLRVKVTAPSNIASASSIVTVSGSSSSSRSTKQQQHQTQHHGSLHSVMEEWLVCSQVVAVAYLVLFICTLWHLSVLSCHVIVTPFMFLIFCVCRPRYF